METPASEPAPVAPGVTDEDNSWALPRPKATPRQKILAVFLAAACLSLTSFTVGVSVGKNRAPDATGSGGFGRNAGSGGFGGFGAATGGGSAAVSTASTSPPTTTIDPGLGGLLPGLDAPPDTAAVTTAAPTTSALPAS